MSGSTEHKKDFKLFGNRILTLWENSGSTFLYLYLKEVYRIVTRKLANQTVEPSKKIFVKRNKFGYPKIIPRELQKQLILARNPYLRDEKVRNLWIIVPILTIISLYRVLPTKVKPSLDTILDKHSGEILTFHPSLVREALVDLKVYKLIVGRITFTYSDKAGPNTRIAKFGIIQDALAYLHYPDHMYNLLLYLWNNKGKRLFIFFCFYCISLGPLYYSVRSCRNFLYRYFCKPLSLGNLSVVYDQAGKARVIAIANAWVQSALRPLHDSIFRVLNTIPMDGTFDQLKPFERLLETKRTLHGFDLSAATDRLPIQLQAEVLNQLGVNGEQWQKVISLPWMVDDRVVKYAVGQPMGAYSSWAMLALTHHVIVKRAALNRGIVHFEDYCILGDDIVIANDIVADEYLKLMSALGVSISEQKSIISDEFTEFAKRLLGPEKDLSPVGPGLIIQAIRNRDFLGHLVSELIRRDLLDYAYISNLYMNFKKVFKRHSYETCTWWLILEDFALRLRGYNYSGDPILHIGMPDMSYLDNIYKDSIGLLIPGMRQEWRDLIERESRSIMIKLKQCFIPFVMSFTRLDREVFAPVWLLYLLSPIIFHNFWVWIKHIDFVLQMKCAWSVHNENYYLKDRSQVWVDDYIYINKYLHLDPIQVIKEMKDERLVRDQTKRLKRMIKWSDTKVWHETIFESEAFTFLQLDLGKRFRASSKLEPTPSEW
nr:MAG: putative RNA dependent RNA polymerase [Sichuan mito-like virus 42]